MTLYILYVNNIFETVLCLIIHYNCYMPMQLRKNCMYALYHLSKTFVHSGQNTCISGKNNDFILKVMFFFSPYILRHVYYHIRGTSGGITFIVSMCRCCRYYQRLDVMIETIWTKHTILDKYYIYVFMLSRTTCRYYNRYAKVFIKPYWLTLEDLFILQKEILC